MKRLRITDALEEVEATQWQCLTCTDASTDDDRYCRNCRMYWDDVRAELAARRALEDGSR